MPVVTDMNSQPTLGANKKPEHDRDRDRHQDEDDQRIGREEGHAPILVVAEAHLIVGEELMVIEGVAIIDRAEPFDVMGRCMTYLCTAHSNKLVNRKVTGTVSHSSGVTL